MADQFHLNWPVDNHIVNQRFGEKPDFYRPFGLPGHEGLDLFAPMNANVYAAADGQIYEADHPDNHPYGLQIRIQHNVGNSVYRTVYAHLAQVFVQPGQNVKAGDRIGLADNSGNSFGSHLHLTLKIDGAQTPGYPAGVVDPWPYFQTTITTGAQPPADTLIVYTTDLLNLRSGSSMAGAILTVLDQGAPLTVMENTNTARAKIGQAGQWLYVKTTDNRSGYVYAQYVVLTGQAAPATSLVVYATDILNVRAQPSTSANVLTMTTSGEALTVLGDVGIAQSRIGQQGQWLNVKTSAGFVGYVAAWLVSATQSSQPTAPQPLTVYTTDVLNVRAQPSTNSTVLTMTTAKQALTAIEDPATAKAKIGQQGQWMYVQTADGTRGWVAAWYLSANPS